MGTNATPIARIRLARSRVRLFLLPAVLGLVGTALVVGAVVGPPRVGQVGWYALLVGGGALVAVGLGLAAWVRSIGLDVEEAAVRVHWLGGGRRYGLAPGPVTRVRLRGEQASRLRVRRGWLGWGLGMATLRDEEQIQLVRLAPTATLILVPTDVGRLAVAAASEDELLHALSLAAHARQQSEELAQSAPIPETELEAASDAAAAPEPAPHVLTGIERALLEEQLAREGEAALAASTTVTVEPPPVVPVPESDGRRTDVGEPEDEVPRRRGRAVSRRSERMARARIFIGRPRPSAALLLLPLIGAGIVWGAAAMLDRLPDPTSDLGRLTSLALVLAGPATAVGAIMARAWWPRLVGVVVTSGLAAVVFVGRALLG